MVKFLYNKSVKVIPVREVCDMYKKLGTCYDNSEFKLWVDRYRYAIDYRLIKPPSYYKILKESPRSDLPKTFKFYIIETKKEFLGGLFKRYERTFNGASTQEELDRLMTLEKQ